MPHEPNRNLFHAKAAAAAVLGCAVAALADSDTWALLVQNYNPISKTIRVLAVGPGNWLLDLGPWTFAAGCVARARAAARRLERKQAEPVGFQACRRLSQSIGGYGRLGTLQHAAGRLH